MSSDHAAVFAAVLSTLYVAHHVGDQWVQTHAQACVKGQPGWTGRFACLRHVTTITVTKLAALTMATAAVHMHLSAWHMAAGLAADAVSHYWADRRTTLAKLARLTGKSGHYMFGSPRPGRDDNPTLGTGAYNLDQSWHIMWLWIAAFIITAA
jgi:hypothetical protein